MSKITKYCCDECGQETTNKDKKDWITIGQQIKHEGMAIEIKIGNSNADKDSGNYKYEGSFSTEMNFCSSDCFLEYIKADQD